MSISPYSFFITAKIVLFNSDLTKVFLAKRYGENDFDGTFSFIGGKLEAEDISPVSGIAREKNEEIGAKNTIHIAMENSSSLFFTKKDGQRLFVPHYPAVMQSGKIELNQEEYSEYEWVPIEKIEEFEPKIWNVAEYARWAHEVLSANPTLVNLEVGEES